MGKVPREAISSINHRVDLLNAARWVVRGKTPEAIKSPFQLHKTRAWVYVAQGFLPNR